MKKIIIALILVITPTTLLAEDRWYLGVGYGSYNTFETENDPLRNDLADRLFSLYLTDGSNLDFTYRLSLADRSIYQNDSGYSTGNQQLIRADVIYNLISSNSGWFFDIEAGITAPITTASFTQNSVLIEGQKDPGAQIGFGAGFTFARHYTIRINSWIEYSSTQFADGVDVTNAPQKTGGLELIYSW